MDKMYVLVRKDLHPSVRVVQACHAVAEFLLLKSYVTPNWTNGTMVVLGVRDEDELKEWIEKLSEEGQSNFFVEQFIEDGLGVTAAACVLSQEYQHLLRSLTLL